jgi:DNA polymerase-3 subunit epsilon
MSLGFFYDKHRAVDDCMAAIHFLDTMLLDLGKTAMQLLLEEARKPVYRVWSGPVSFDEARNEKLKAAGYRWNPDVKQWHKVVSPEGPDELGFLLGLGVQHAYFNPLSGKDRFTDRG